VVGALVGYMGFRTGCNSGLLFRLVYGNVGAAVPVLFLTVLLIFWQGITVGAFSFAWVQDFESPWFYAVAIFAGLLYTWTTYYGVQGLEKVALPAALILVAVLLYAGWYNVNQAGGWDAFLALSRTTAAQNPLTNVQAMNIVIGSWIVGAVVMAEYTRFARQAWVAIAIPFIVLIVTQWILQFVGAMGGVVSGNFDFTVYMRSVGTFVSLFGLIAFIGSYFWYRALSDAVPFVNRRLFFIFMMFAPSILFWPSSLGKEALMQLGLGAVAWATSDGYPELPATTAAKAPSESRDESPTQGAPRDIDRNHRTARRRRRRRARPSQAVA
jgi:hypothetical protein